MIARRLSFSAISMLLGCASVMGCGSSSPSGPAGGPVTGALDDHCAAVTPIVVNPASCHPADTTGDDDADGGVEEESPVLYNASGDDDDCKYQVAFTSTPVRMNENVTFTVTASDLAPPATGTAVTGANIQIESYVADNQFHVIPNTNPSVSEAPAGTYKVGPIRFDMSGRWVVRFHLFEDCSDLTDDSPHGHIAFYVDVP